MIVVEIASEDMTGHVLLEPNHTGDGLIVEIVSAGLVGVDRGVRLGPDLLLGFADGLEGLLGGRPEPAVLEGGGIALRVSRNGDEWVVMARMEKPAVMMGQGVRHLLSTVFLADQETVANAVEDLRALAEH